MWAQVMTLFFLARLLAGGTAISALCRPFRMQTCSADVSEPSGSAQVLALLALGGRAGWPLLQTLI